MLLVWLYGNNNHRRSTPGVWGYLYNGGGLGALPRKGLQIKDQNGEILGYFYSKHFGSILEQHFQLNALLWISIAITT